MEGSKKGNKEEGVKQRDGATNEEIAETTEEKERKDGEREIVRKADRKYIRERKIEED